MTDSSVYSTLLCIFAPTSVFFAAAFAIYGLYLQAFYNFQKQLPRKTILLSMRYLLLSVFSITPFLLLLGVDWQNTFLGFLPLATAVILLRSLAFYARLKIFRQI